MLLKITGCGRHSFDVTSSGRKWLPMFLRHFSSENDPYLHRSRVPTLHFQKSLPRLPIPALEKTCRRYLDALAPISTKEALDKTNLLVDEFQKGAGKELNQLLIEEDKANKHTSYITAPWFDMYLKDRAPIALNYNPFIAFTDDERPAYNEQTVRAANFLVSAIRFRETLRAGLLEPEVYHLDPRKSDTEAFRSFVRLLPPSLSWYGAYWYKAFPLDMSQYSSLFNSTRIPEVGKDRLVREDAARHILVMRRGHFYVFDVLDANGCMLEPTRLHACLQWICRDEIPSPSHSLGYLTSEDRDIWAGARRRLVDDGNGPQLAAIDSALFNLVLDNADTQNDPRTMSKLFLHGDGANRWFDKSFSLIVSRDGKAAVNFEHSWGDGVAVMRFFNEVHKDSTSRVQVHPDAPVTASDGFDPSQHVHRLEFRLSDAIKATVDAARKRFHAATDQLAVDLFVYEGFSKSFCKQQKVSPDAIMQLGFQVAYHRLNGSACATYESCSTAAFKHGRTETIRPCTRQTQVFSQAVNGKKGSSHMSKAELRALITACSTAHGQLTKEAAMGEGFDRHLFALKYLAQQRSLPIPSLYADPSYAKINHNVLSTSTLSSPAVLLGGFAPVVDDGYGIGYSIQENLLGAVVTTYPPGRSGSDFVACLESSFRDIRQILDG